MRAIRKAHQDVGTDPFEGIGSGWDELDEMAEDFTWATAPATGSNHHVRRKGPPARTHRRA